MKKLIFIFTLLLSITSFAQNDAKALLDEVSKKVKSYDNIAIDFKYVLHNTAENIKQETRGDVVMQGEKYKLNILGITRIYDGKTLYSISPEDEQVTISSESMDDEGSITPSKMLSFYEDGFTYKMDIVQNVQGRKIQYVLLNPKDSNSEIKSILLGIDAHTKHIYNLIETGKNGTKTTLTVNSFKTNEPISKSLFTFDKSKYTDYYIENLD
ncbi:outer membrane lipoprotein carrier protein LolA [Oceanihabitans sediminis]|uniref:Outer membrane lipoprotein carrier protein LolA n=1 Tax=Oceanihabitans sediminis TaxID=1812012 RepID=A0A368P459_9FLAO|nr:outer membrane lipoprotein carrier protein LolA [Oceanihabitans sediminis]MDX1279289.1 outer membrane lipoprotein carrier protein LolA [Oceanihabitans sediminis]MDX1773354.1 outer membrane lipoprotein carrier protein LolA [Oceanihabitans sediminis]RBP32810.1 outer membrane lipoprotein-sorting protein [Oceanihabitans sediminis]RCU57657.1 outer membrane lipoprotein carrier protein LolA [Oceanihabitans sediminis]